MKKPNGSQIIKVKGSKGRKKGELLSAAPLSTETAMGRIQAYLSRNGDVFSDWFSSDHSVVFTGPLAGRKSKRLLSQKYVYLRKSASQPIDTKKSA